MSTAAAYKDARTTAVESIASGVASSEVLYEALRDFAYGRSTVPDWRTLLDRWRSALDQQTQALTELTTFHGGP